MEEDKPRRKRARGLVGWRREGAEYLTAVSRLADSGCSCSESSMRCRQWVQETAVKIYIYKKRKGKSARPRAREIKSMCV